MRSRKFIAILSYLHFTGQVCLAAPLLVPSPEVHTRDDALNFWHTATTVLAPVYGPLAEQIVSEFRLAEGVKKRGDVGSTETVRS